MSRAAAAVLLVGLLAGCQRDQGDAAGATVFAAASTSSALDAVLAERDDIRTSYAASGTLSLQIEAGAPADVLLSANEEWVDRLDEAGLIRTRTVLLRNQLVMIAPAGVQPATLEAARFVAIGEPDSVPAGRYAQQALQSQGSWDGLSGRLVRGTDVRQVLLFVERGEAELGFVYRSDAQRSSGVQVCAALPVSDTGPIRYTLALVSESEDAVALYEWLQAPEQLAVFEEFGFERPGE